jgi:hypothetical protein
MARRRSYVSTYAQLQREATRAQAARVRAQAAARREADQAQAAYVRAQAAPPPGRPPVWLSTGTAHGTPPAGCGLNLRVLFERVGDVPEQQSEPVA